jgi:hypothetical protein
MAKGGTFEREICVILSNWWTDGQRDDIFGRSDSSGGRFTARKKVGKDTANMSGDITFTDILGEPLIKVWNIETKTGYGSNEKIKDSSGQVIKKVQLRWDILDILDSNQKQTVLETMWEQCCRDANLSNRIPILIFRRNQRKICIAITSDYLRSLAKYYGPPSCKRIRYDFEDFHLFVMPLKDCLEWLHDFDKYLH